MANIHTIHDHHGPPTQSSQPTSAAFPRPIDRGDSVINVSSANQRSLHPSCVDLFFPGFTWQSFILWISFVQIIVFLASLVVGSYGLTPNGTTLSRFGDSFGPAIQRGEVWRLITPIFLHASIWHILFNVFFQMRMGFPLERQYGTWLFAGFYFICGIAGNLFSVALAPCKSAVGASTAGFGLIGIQTAELALTWHLIQQKDQAIFNIVLFLVMSIMISIGPHSVVDWRGHLGGFVAGFALGVMYNKSEATRPAWYTSGKSASAFGLAALYIISLAVIFAIPMSTRCH